MKIKEIIEVEVDNIEVDNKYYSFDYKITRSGKVVSDSSFSSDHSWGDNFEKFKDLLKTSFAVELALENFPITSIE